MQELVNFLKKENSMLRQQNQQLRQLVNINKEAMRVSLEIKKGQKSYPPLINLLYKENMKLVSTINTLKSELDDYICKTLVSHQIAFASTEHQRYMTNQLKQKLSKLRKQLDQRQRKIIQLQKVKTVPETNNQIKLVEVIDPKVINLKLKDQINYLYEELHLKKIEIEKVKDQKEQLLKLNLILTKQIKQLKSTAYIETTKSKPEDLENSSDISKLMNYQKKMLSGGDAELNSDHMDEQSQSNPVSSSQCSQQLEMEQQEKQNNTFSVMQKSKFANKLSSVPKLQLTKAKQIQQLIVKKLINDDKKKNQTVVKEEKYRKLENQLTQFRKRHGKLLIQKAAEERQNSSLRRMIRELQQRNIILAQQKQLIQQGQQYEKRTKLGQQTVLDIYRDVVMNEKLQNVIDGTVELVFKNVQSYQL